ncbi:hypothetical protein CAP35_09160 [Chitinophagaceae bacterium IBVUCB1]|nr:hypothetical protein CAP35_09160 [Chitinophagaceae bacterium IBVUCB1]
MRKIIFVLSFLYPLVSFSQPTYKAEIEKWRKEYKQAFIKEERSPLKGNDTAMLRFFDIDKRYSVTAKFNATPASQAFEMPTYSGKTKTFRQYGTAMFVINDTVITLSIYQNLKLLEDTAHKNHLFIPFTDATSYIETYAGGRYIDLETTDIKNGELVIDFNKCYNPYCAYAAGYNCPIPPVENRMDVAIKAGEKLYAGKHKE